jgi:short subunit dehydrogenase-like uncharacterized protein
MNEWMLYGAYGYTGQLIIEEAVARGHQPLLAGRSAEKLKPLAERYGLPSVAFDLDNAEAALREHRVPLVLHVAGPFVRTSAPMVNACLRTKTHYLDITGEIPVFESVLARHADASASGIVLMPGVGLDIVPTECLARYVIEQVPDAVTLDVAMQVLNPSNGEPGFSRGTLKTALDMFADGGCVRRGGKLVRHEIGLVERKFRFPHGVYAAVAVPVGDVITAWYSHHIPNITVYAAFPPSMLTLARTLSYVINAVVRRPAVRQWISEQVDRVLFGPSELVRQTGRTYQYARAEAADGRSAEAWLETTEGYRFTALAAVRAVERVLDGSYQGALTPAQAFGADFVLDIPTTKRHDKI